MRRIARIDRSIDLLKARSRQNGSLPYLCLACKIRTSSFSTSTQSRKNVSFTEKLRQKIWGTENPPGLKDPYRGRTKLDEIEQNREKVKEEKRKGRETRIELRKQTIKPDMRNYEPAITWDTLEEVGYEIQDSGPPFRGFMETEVLTDGDEITVAMHRAMVEIVALQLSGKSLDSISTSFPTRDMAQDVQLVVSGNTIDLVYSEDSPFGQVLQSFNTTNDAIDEEAAPMVFEQDIAVDGLAVDSLKSHSTAKPASELSDVTAGKENPTDSEKDTATDRSEVDTLGEMNFVEDISPERTYEELVAAWDPAWLQISLKDPELKFAFVKRVMQLTGIRISDAHLNSTRSVEGLLKHLVKPAPPAKLVDALAEKEDLMTLPNVSVFATRRTQKHEEISVGRWKVIERELEEQGLPVPWSSERPARPTRPKH